MTDQADAPDDDQPDDDDDDDRDRIGELLSVDPASLPSFFVPFEDRWDGDGPMPERSLPFMRIVPDLAGIHPRRWEAVLLPLRRELRSYAVFTTSMTPPEVDAGM